MIPKGLFTQIGMVIVAVAIIITYVQPAFSEIGAVQDEISVYQSEREKVVSVNEDLAKLVSRMESVSNDDEKRLMAYLPNEIDGIHIQRDLLLIAEEANVLVKSTNNSGENNKKRATNSVQEENLPIPHTFSFSVEGTFDQIKNLFRLMEQNHYPLEVESVNIIGQEGNFLAVDITFATYTYQAEDSANKVIF